MKRARHGFTLIELLVVMAVIAILTAIVLGALPAILNWAAKARARSEIHAMEVALGNYKLDTGTYPPGDAAGYDPRSAYVNSAVSLYTNLSGRISEAAPVTGKSFLPFKKSQLGISGANNYVQDPFGYAYGYCTNAPDAGNNSGFYDLWSTSGKTDNSQTSTNVWVTNWRED